MYLIVIAYYILQITIFKRLSGVTSARTTDLQRVLVKRPPERWRWSPGVLPNLLRAWLSLCHQFLPHWMISLQKKIKIFNYKMTYYFIVTDIKHHHAQVHESCTREHLNVYPDDIARLWHSDLHFFKCHSSNTIKSFHRHLKYLSQFHGILVFC